MHGTAATQPATALHLGPARRRSDDRREIISVQVSHPQATTMTLRSDIRDAPTDTSAGAAAALRATHATRADRRRGLGPSRWNVPK